jgi:transcriptional regulator with XRE-family HTH domain
MDFSKAVRIARSIAGYTQKELAELAEVDPSIISMIEAGKRQPTTSTLMSLSEGLGIPVHLLTMLGAEEKDLHDISPENFRSLSESIARLILTNEPRSKSGPSQRKLTFEA